MSEKMKALDELAKMMSKLKGDKYKSRKSKPMDVVCEEEGCEDESHDHKDPEVEIEVVEMEDEESPEEAGPKSFSEVLAEVAAKKNKKH